MTNFFFFNLRVNLLVWLFGLGIFFETVSQYSPGHPGTQMCLCLPSARIKGVYHHLSLNFRLCASVLREGQANSLMLVLSFHLSLGSRNHPTSPTPTLGSLALLQPAVC